MVAVTSPRRDMPEYDRDPPTTHDASTTSHPKRDPFAAMTDVGGDHNSPKQEMPPAKKF